MVIFTMAACTGMNGVPGDSPRSTWRAPAARRAGIFLTTWAAATVHGAGIEIRGGRDPDNEHFYRYTVFDGESSAIIAVDFPHYGADLFKPPANWAFEVTERNALTGSAGRCIAKAPAGQEGILPGRDAEFTLRIGPRGALDGTGTAKVTLADGRIVPVDVRCSIGESALERHAALIGMVLVSAAFILISIWRARRKKKPPIAPA
jgi:hypothetical protein